MKRFEEPGVWWRPERHKEEGVTGIVRHEPYGPTALDMLGSLDPNAADVRVSSDPAKTDPVVLAEVEKHLARIHAEIEAGTYEQVGLGRYDDFPAHIPVLHGVNQGALVTLLELTESRRDDSAVPGFPRSHWSARAVLRGGHVAAWGEQTYSTARFTFEHLADWCDLALLADEAEENSDATSDNTTGLAPAVTLTCNLDDGTEVLLNYRSASHYTLDQRTISRQPQFFVKLAIPTTLPDILDRYLRPLRDLLTTATGRPAAITELFVSSTEVTWDNIPQPIEVGLADSIPSPDRAPASSYGVALPLAAIDYTTFVPSWFRVHDARNVAAEFVYANRYGHVDYSGMRLLSATTGVEAFHASKWPDTRTPFDLKPAAVDCILNEFPPIEHPLLRDRARHFNKPSLRNRLRETVEYAAPLSGNFAPQLGRWVDTVVWGRNAVAHGEADRPNGAELRAMAEACGHLVELALLIEAGADTTVLAERLPRSPHHANVVLWREQYLDPLIERRRTEQKQAERERRSRERESAQSSSATRMPPLDDRRESAD